MCVVVVVVVVVRIYKMDDVNKYQTHFYKL